MGRPASRSMDDASITRRGSCWEAMLSDAVLENQTLAYHVLGQGQPGSVFAFGCLLSISLRVQDMRAYGVQSGGGSVGTRESDQPTTRRTDLRWHHDPGDGLAAVLGGAGQFEHGQDDHVQWSVAAGGCKSHDSWRIPRLACGADK